MNRGNPVPSSSTHRQGRYWNESSGCVDMTGSNSRSPMSSGAGRQRTGSKVPHTKLEPSHIVEFTLIGCFENISRVSSLVLGMLHSRHSLEKRAKIAELAISEVTSLLALVRKCLSSPAITLRLSAEELPISSAFWPTILKGPSRSPVPDSSVHPVTYQERPSIDEARSFFHRCQESPSSLISYDIETPTSRDLPEDERESDPSYEIESIQFSLAPYTGIFMPWTGEYIEIARQILALPNPKAGHGNWEYDDPSVTGAGNHDRTGGTTMLGGCGTISSPIFRLICSSLLRFMEWTSRGSILSGSQLRNSTVCADVDAPQRIMATALADLERRGLRGSYERHVMGLHPILLATADRDPIDESQRMMMSVELDQAKRETNAELQTMYPDSIRRCSPSQGTSVIPNPPMASSSVNSRSMSRSRPSSMDSARPRFARTRSPAGVVWNPSPPLNPRSLNT